MHVRWTIMSSTNSELQLKKYYVFLIDANIIFHMKISVYFTILQFEHIHCFLLHGHWFITCLCTSFQTASSKSLKKKMTHSIFQNNNYIHHLKNGL